MVYVCQQSELSISVPVSGCSRCLREAGMGGPMTGMKAEDWKRPFEVNVHGAFYVVRAAAPLLRRGGSIVFLSSGAGHDPIEGLSAYGASKAAVNHLATVLAQELGPQ